MHALPCFSQLLSKIRLWTPAEITSSVTHPLLTFFLPWLTFSFPYQHFLWSLPNKWLVFKSLSRGLLLGEPKPRPLLAMVKGWCSSRRCRSSCLASHGGQTLQEWSRHGGEQNRDGKWGDFFFFYIFSGVQLLYNIVLVSAVQQSESAICIHISPYTLPLDKAF